MKYIFKQVDDFTPSETTVEFEADSLTTVLEQFKLFLLGAGYQIEGSLDIVNDDLFDFDEEEVDDILSSEESWPFPTERPSEAEDNSLCPVCKISYKVMEGNACYDANCPRKD